ARGMRLSPGVGIRRYVTPSGAGDVASSSRLCQKRSLCPSSAGIATNTDTGSGGCGIMRARDLDCGDKADVGVPHAEAAGGHLRQTGFELDQRAIGARYPDCGDHGKTKNPRARTLAVPGAWW